MSFHLSKIFKSAEQIAVQAATTGVGVVNPNLVPTITDVVRDLMQGGHLDQTHAEKLAEEIVKTGRTVAPYVT